ncbi:DUF1194 domain-containing protein [Roseomonas genomospecies 6]|uniref:DUF1194 domain-containing protein n=1 Tax=Roseomonas genomospecies 6 TaxID=214106 RepID=A0A9W7U0I1_9PROT|nr:DUF1194 domain-containing protein [Roseomonas genomospecies 6]KAA0684193.1 DUF1194 domain-containing protein [Roseomonas genomospecies 6]
MRRRTILALPAFLAGAWLAGPLRAEPKAKTKPSPSAPAGRRVALELVLAVDGSASITDGDLEFQLQGHAAAFRDPDVSDAVTAGGMAATLVVFSGPRNLRVLVPWSALTSAEEVAAFAERIDKAPRGFQGDSTALGNAIGESAKLFAGNGFDAPRKVIDIVSNGFSNSGPDPAGARDRAERQGITINALAILDEFPWLEEYYQENVVGGVNSFVKTAMDRSSFVEALRQKLIQEIAARPVPHSVIAAANL